MKRIIFSIAALFFVAASLCAQSTEQIHVFRNDNKFHTHKASELEKIHFTEGADGFTKLVITRLDGSVSSIDMNAVDSCVFATTGIPEFHVNLVDYPDWTELQGAKDVVRTATLRMDGNGMYDDLPEQTVEFRGRGNSTWNMPKKPYRFKMASKTKVCGLPKAKTFALIANYIDCSLMRNAVALWLANYLQMPFSNHCVPVKVYLNGIDKGAYMLTEKIGIGGGSVNIPEETGMLFEIASNYDEDFKFRYYFNEPSSGNNGWQKQVNLPVMVKDPDLTELQADTIIENAYTYFSTWQEDFTKMADAVTSRSASESLSDVLDIESVVNFFIVNGISNNHEMHHPKSFYIHKKSLDEGEVYHFGPVWDFDWSFTFDGEEGAPANVPLVSNDGDCGGYSFLKYLFSNEEFRSLFNKRLNEFYQTGYPAMLAYMEQYATLIEPTAKENGLMWPANRYADWCITTSSYDFRKNFETLKAWIDQRLEYMLNHENFGLFE